MEKIILGLLMLRRLTVYEIRSILSKNFKTICSDSMGGIQAAIKRLLDSGKITFHEFVEKGVNKKHYSITDEGRDDLRAWVNAPAIISNPKNMELGKLVFMGLVPSENRKALIDDAIAALHQDIAYLMEIKNSSESSDVNEKMLQTLNAVESDRAYSDGIKNMTGNDDLTQSFFNYTYYERAVLQYSIDITKLQIEWLTKLSNKEI